MDCVVLYIDHRVAAEDGSKQVLGDIIGFIAGFFHKAVSLRRHYLGLIIVI